MLLRARRRLTLLYIALFAVVLAGFSVVFWLALSIVIQPAFDVEPELSNEQATQQAYRATVERIGIAIVVADVVSVVLVGGGAWLLSARTLRPIDDAHERQRRFVADASHEMRTPVAAIRSTAEIALLAGGDEVAREDALRTIAATGARLGRIIDDLLLLARTERGEVPRRIEEIDLGVLAAEAVDQALAAEPGLPRVALEVDPDVLTVGDPDEVARIVLNLIDNARRHGRVDVRVGVAALDGHPTVDVSDRGPGLTAEEAERVFEPFHRGTGEAPGTGLGLPIALGLAERNGGRLTLTTAPGGGCTFRLTLARAPHRRAATRRASEADERAERADRGQGPRQPRP